VEAAIDFPEEEIELLQREELSAKVEALKNKISVLIASYEWGRLFREGARVCIAGRPNVGKSSLLNALLGEERVIVTPVPGTTRDVIEESINLGGLPVVLWDTAGIRRTDDEVERIGVDFSLKRLEEAEALIVVVDGSAALTDEDCSILVATRAKKGLVVINKNDLPTKVAISELKSAAAGKELISVSAKEREGLEQLRVDLRDLLLEGAQSNPPMILTNVRHKASLQRADEALSQVIESLRQSLPSELVAVELQRAREGLEEVIGVVSDENILERIFRDFCIGK